MIFLSLTTSSWIPFLRRCQTKCWKFIQLILTALRDCFVLVDKRGSEATLRRLKSRDLTGLRAPGPLSINSRHNLSIVVPTEHSLCNQWLWSGFLVRVKRDTLEWLVYSTLLLFFLCVLVMQTDNYAFESVRFVRSTLGRCSRVIDVSSAMAFKSRYCTILDNFKCSS